MRERLTALGWDRKTLALPVAPLADQRGGAGTSPAKSSSLHRDPLRTSPIRAGLSVTPRRDACAIAVRSGVRQPLAGAEAASQNCAGSRRSGWQGQGDRRDRLDPDRVFLRMTQNWRLSVR